MSEAAGPRAGGASGARDVSGAGGAGGAGGAALQAPAPRDPGLQPERTRLAWRRTTLTCTVAAVLGARAALRDGASVVAAVACALCLLLWLGFLVVAHRRMTTLTAARPRALSRRAAAAATVCTGALAVCAAALIL
ncbi:DUF202 domain-containing protein [Streptomyces flavofungini]|uniref:DUF202 domain-containing protein n=1 Tax=Streptomyces flavofungini TaxID=68200 RepID=UPI0025B0B261|nr:DUF202 domain-containing protein [Streptomyces flavofungini]WJV49787.1 DUF202 domain-containing protein [Streptomyces flavofungini]